MKASLFLCLIIFAVLQESSVESSNFFSRNVENTGNIFRRVGSMVASGVASAGKSVYGTLMGTTECKAPMMICPNEDITFHLFNRNVQSEDGYQLKEYEPETIAKAPFVIPGQLIITCHGYTSHYKSSPAEEIIDAYKKTQKPVNIIAINWKDLCPNSCYRQAAKNVNVVGKCTGAFIKTLLEHQTWLNLKDIHFIGFSLGAQVGGQIANHIMSGNTLSRITALDPAWPLFDPLTCSKYQRLDPSDADFVDVYHTNAGNKGHLMNIGHVDFYANYGLSQPGCGVMTSWKELVYSTCDHWRAVLYYAESIYSTKGFYAYPYDVVSVFTHVIGLSKRPGILAGAYVDHNVRGSYFFSTNSRAPFAKGEISN